MARIAVVGLGAEERAALVAALSRRGHETQEWGTSSAALAALLERPPEALLVDRTLPDGDGRDLIARLRARHGAFPVILVSADPIDRVRGPAVGASHVLMPPAQPAFVLGLLQRLLTPSATAAASQASPARPATLGRYVIRGELGHGSYGVVYDAWDPTLQAEVALKVLAPMVDDLDVLARFVREARVLAKVKDPHLVPFLDAGVINGRAFCAMRRLRGPTLSSRVDREGRLEEHDMLSLLWGLLRALDALAQQNLVHRDVTPRNVILEDGRPERPVLIDFGLAKRSSEQGLTNPDQILGTPGFIAPEVIRGAEADARSDLFAVGQAALFAVNGVEPFEGLRGMQLLRHMLVTPTPIPDHVSPATAELLASLTAIDPLARPASARVALARLAVILRQRSASLLASA